MVKLIARKDTDQTILRKRSVSTGSALCILGIGSIIALLVIDRLSTWQISMAMLAAGLLQVSHALAAHRRGWPAFTILAAVLYIGAALAILFEPLIEMRWIAFLLVGSLAASGISRLATAARLGSRLRGWEALSGMTTLGVAAIVEGGLPEMSLWPLGFLIALDLMVEGAALANVGWSIAAPRED